MHKSRSGTWEEVERRKEGNDIVTFWFKYKTICKKGNLGQSHTDTHMHLNLLRRLGGECKKYNVPVLS